MNKSLKSVFLSAFRTESVAEKMLTNWFTFLLYKFLKVSVYSIYDIVTVQYIR